MSCNFNEKYSTDKKVWDSCAENYEHSIVEGHPDVTAYENFEEDFLDRLLLYLTRDCQKTLTLFDIGCGSGRLHQRYGLKISVVDDDEALSPKSTRIQHARRSNPAFLFDTHLHQGLLSIGGIDFSQAMIRLAQEKMSDSGLEDLMKNRKLGFEVGSAFDLSPLNVPQALPICVALCNTIGVMQGPAGAARLFDAMKRMVAENNGIAIISAYRQEAVETFALGNYESTMDVCGQPRWLKPNTFASLDKYIQRPIHYKRSRDPDQTVTVNVYTHEGQLVQKEYQLVRDVDSVKQVLKTGHIQTYTDYESHWYSFEQFEQWIAEHWSSGETHHLLGTRLDKLRAEPAQLAILDYSGLFKGFVERYVS